MDTENAEGEDGDLIVAVFDTKYVALRTLGQLRAAEFYDHALGIVSGESSDGETTIVADDASPEDVLLHEFLAARGASEAHAHRFDGILPPGSAVMALITPMKHDRAVQIIELSGGHIEHV